ncbi:MAG: transporter substrate-binding domain-containing protein [Candidatus Cyclobacteriaceae bacterium M3_2C_046]
MVEKNKFVLLILLCLVYIPLWSQSTDSLPSGLVVGTKSAPPFSIKNDDGSWSGLSIELWESIAQDLDIQFEYREYDLEGLLQSVNQSEIDVAIGALTINDEREQFLDFSHPYYVTGLGIAVKANQGNLWGVFDRLFSVQFFQAVGGLVIILLIFGFLIWLFERKRNPEQFGGKAIEGIGSGFWWSAVTMTTVGYGDKAPSSLGGRIIALVWMFMALIVISSFTAAIASALTVNELSSSIQGIEDLYKSRVATIQNSSSESFLNERDIWYKTYETPLQALNALAAEDVDAVVYDKPILQYILQQEIGDQIRILPQDFKPVHYGLAFPSRSNLREPVNVEILQLTVQPEWRDITAKYLGE